MRRRALLGLGALGLAALGALVARAQLRIVPAPATPLAGQVDRILIEKSARRMTVFRGGRPLRVYAIRLGFAPEGDKRREGDGRTPEGLYRIDRKNPRSAYHLSLGIDYPRPDQRARAAAAGEDPGGDIFIHGQPAGVIGARTALHDDWTAGCIAVSNAEMEELYAAVPLGAAVEIRP